MPPPEEVISQPNGEVADPVRAVLQPRQYVEDVDGSGGRNEWTLSAVPAFVDVPVVAAEPHGGDVGADRPDRGLAIGDDTGRTRSRTRIGSPLSSPRRSASVTCWSPSSW